MLPSGLWGDSETESFSLSRAVGLATPFAESLRPLESIQAAQGAWALSSAADLGAADLSLQLQPGLTLSRTTRRALAPRAGVAWGSALDQSVTDALTLALGERSQFSASREVSSSRDLAQRLLGSGEKRRLGFSQGFGAGQSTGTLTMERSWLTQVTGNNLTNAGSQKLGLTTGWGQGYSLAANFGQTWSTTEALPASERLHLGPTRSTALRESSQSWDALLGLPFSGGAGSVGFSRTDAVKGEQRSGSTNWKLAAPLYLFGGKANLAGARTVSYVDTARVAEDLASLTTPLPGRINFTGNLHTIRPSTPGALRLRDQSMVVDFPAFFGQRGRFDTQRMRQTATGVDRELSVDNFVLPLGFVSRQGLLEIHHKDDLNNGVVSRSLVGQFSTPLPASWLPGAAFTQSYQRLSTGGPSTTVVASALSAPWKGFGTSGDFKQQYITTETPGGFQARLVTDLGAQVNHQRLGLTRDFSRTRSGESYQERQMLALVTPRFELFTPKATISAGRVQITQEPGTDSNQTTLTVAAQPTDRLTMAARMQDDTTDPGADVRTEQVLGSLQLGKYLSLQTRMDTRDQNDQPCATVVRSVQIKREQDSPSGVGLLVGYAEWDQPGAGATEGPDLQLKVGDSTRGVGVLAQLSGYDANKMTPYNDPLVKVTLSHGAASGMSVRMDYGDQEGRPAPERNYQVGMQALGGNVQLGFAQNPLDRTGKVVLPGDRYDAALQRRVGTVDVKLGYRVYNFREPVNAETTVDYYSIQLAGGAEERGGKLALGYAMGDFVPKPDPNTAVAGSVLDLSYSRRWADNGRLIVSLQRTTPPENGTTPAGSTQGRLEYSTVF